MANKAIPDWVLKNGDSVKSILERFRKKRILIIGDLILDQFIWGDVSRISPEAPVPVVWVKRESYMPGGACNVAHNLSELGSKVSVVGIVGDDANGGILLSELNNIGIDTAKIIRDSSRPTTHKVRVIAHSQQVVRIDRENPEAVSRKSINSILDMLEEEVKEADAVIIEDYGKGLITSQLVKRVVELGKKFKKVITVDPKKEHFKYYKGITAITPNRAEAEEAVGFKIEDEESLKRAGGKLIKKLNAKSALITLGDKGIYLFESRKRPLHIPTMARQVYDVSGAGDTVIAVFTLTVASGASLAQAAYIANQAAGIVVGKIGTATVSKRELWGEIRKWK
ncbi:MAG: D-glycero-beta-D-manno-heptose-7-phosphate kinase [Candidatus Kaelpia imicola]|nr:D-glycero-beta-D-manno-heptose-7-phosphate kinase [Candidatus Kaelpia imicola]